MGEKNRFIDEMNGQYSSWEQRIAVPWERYPQHRFSFSMDTTKMYLI